MRSKIKLPKYVNSFVAKGRRYYYFRAKGVAKRLPGQPGAIEFHEAYTDALRATSYQPLRVREEPGTLGWLITAYKSSPTYTKKSLSTKVSYDRELERLKPIRHFPAVDIRRRHINIIRDRLSDKPRTRQLFGQVCSLLFNFGIRELELELMNPARLMKREGEAVSYRKWSLEEMEVFEGSNPPCHLMSAYMVGRYTGPRRGDIVGLKRSNYRDGYLQIAGSKTSNPIQVPVHRRLKLHLDSLPATLTLIAGSKWTASQSQSLVKGHAETSRQDWTSPP